MTNAGAGMACPVCKVALVMSDRRGDHRDHGRRRKSLFEDLFD